MTTPRYASLSCWYPPGRAIRKHTDGRHRRGHDHLLGRVESVHRLADLGGAAPGAVAGGLVAEYVGLLVPFWGTTASVGLLTVVTRRPIVTTERL